MVHKKLISLLFLVLGLSLLYIGGRDIYVISSYLDSLVPITPDTETKVYIIMGTAASVAGFAGIIRDKIIKA